MSTVGLFAIPQAVCYGGAAWLFHADKWQGWALIVVGVISTYAVEIRK